MNWLKTLNPKALLLKFLKGLAVKEIQKQGDALQTRLRLAIEEHGPKAIDKVIDSSQTATLRLINARLPKWAWLTHIKDRIAEEVTQSGDKLQERLKEQIASNGISSVDVVFDKVQAELIERIEAL